MAPTVPLRPLLGALRQDGYALGVATNATMAEAEPHLDGAGIAEFFDFVAGCDAGLAQNPIPACAWPSRAHLGCAPERVVMVGDSLHDLRAGRAAGMRTAAVLTGVAGPEELTPFADVVLSDIGQLPAWLKEAGFGAGAAAR